MNNKILPFHFPTRVSFSLFLSIASCLIIYRRVLCVSEIQAPRLLFTRHAQRSIKVRGFLPYNSILDGSDGIISKGAVVLLGYNRQNHKSLSLQLKGNVIPKRALYVFQISHLYKFHIV